MRTSPTIQRDEGLRRVSRVSRWVAGASVAAAGLFTLIAAHPKLPTVRLARTTDDAGNSAASTGSSDDSGQGSLSAPSQLPAPATSSPQVVSGSS